MNGHHDNGDMPAFWDHVMRSAVEVETWPAWRRSDGDRTELRGGLVPSAMRMIQLGYLTREDVVAIRRADDQGLAFARVARDRLPGKALEAVNRLRRNGNLESRDWDLLEGHLSLGLLAHLLREPGS